MTQRKNHKPIIAALAVLACMLIMEPGGVVYGEDTNSPEGTTYTYEADGKPDPFDPFIDVSRNEEEEQRRAEAAKAAKAAARAAAEAKAKAERLRFLPPLQRFSLDEFKLVAVGGTTHKKVAIVEDSKGKSFSIFMNSKIGMNEGRVVAIRDDRVIILERIRDAEGKITARRVALKLMKDNIEGDQ